MRDESPSNYIDALQLAGIIREVVDVSIEGGLENTETMLAMVNSMAATSGLENVPQRKVKALILERLADNMRN